MTPEAVQAEALFHIGAALAGIGLHLLAGLALALSRPKTEEGRFFAVTLALLLACTLIVNLTILLNGNVWFALLDPQSYVELYTGKGTSR